MRLLTRIITFSFVGALLLLAGCDSLNLEPKDEFQASQVFEDPALAQSYLNQIYTRTGLGYGDPMQTPGITDEAYNTHGHPGSQNVMSTVSPGDRGIWDAPGWRAPDAPYYQGYNWGSVWSSIRDLNLFIQNVKGNEQVPPDQRQLLLGEAYFLRGFFYQNLMKLYGGVPIVKQVFDLGAGEEQYQVERNTFPETINSIVSDLDSSATLLAGKEPRRQGAATEAAARALKSRVLLYAASDLYHNSPFSGDVAQYVSYTSGDQQQRWQEAMNAAQDVIDMWPTSLEQDLSAEEYHRLFTKGNPNGTIWARYFDPDASFNHNQSTFVSPNGYFSWSGDTPTQQHVNAYEMADGSDFQWEGGDPSLPNPEEQAPDRDPVEAENPYDDRDPRLHANIHFNGADWRERPAGTPRSTDPEGVYQPGVYELPDGSMKGGLDTDAGPQPWNSSQSGYNLRKFVDRDIVPNNEQAYNPWIYIRYAEVLLNKAEAAANLGNMSAALQAVNKVRSRVGMPDLQMTNSSAPTYVSGQEDLLEEIRQEREVELAFEGHRYFDVRRWMIGEEAYQDAHAIQITGTLTGSPGSDMALGELIAQDMYDYSYKVINIQEREWDDCNYFLPFPNDEVNRNPNLGANQNPLCN
jgi:hypothetical protein